ncbi:hypothetical protein Dsin_014883 [Dipteronia sinensis]|uniref:AN1-type domain-containing protein n=1 Tax=Dipteronia sinensis TaxID=43782 RepID=A0AAE0EA82_9ROSI|nr:hypothetical protein Dsin_014883 [Dipteronia sinensis]
MKSLSCNSKDCKEATIDSTTTRNAASHRGLCVKGCGFYGLEEKKSMCSKFWLQNAECCRVRFGFRFEIEEQMQELQQVGLTGFKCRCGDLFCGKHPYATEHFCTFDYKKFDLEILIKENQLIKEHSCTFDYKKFDREILVKENQLIKCDKLAQRI